MSDKRKVLLIVNPCAGKNKTRAGTFDIVDRFSAEDYDFTVKTTTGPGDATDIVLRCGEEHDMVVCCGGDGTLYETINGVMQLPNRLIVGYIPAGSTNDLASTIGLPRGDFKAATDIIIDGNTNGYDIGLFNNKFFTYVASFGFGISLSYGTSQKMKNKLGHAAYVVDGAILKLPQLIKEIRPIHLKFEYDDGLIEDDFYFGAISNATTVAGTFKYDENDVRLDDGVFEVLLIRRVKSPLDVLKLLGKVRKADFDGDQILYFKTKRARMVFSKPEKWTLDGEYGGEHRDVRFSVINKAIDICSPDGNPLFVGDKKQETADR